MANKMTLDFTNVKDGGGAFNKKRQPEGDYRGQVTKVATVPIKDSKDKQWLFTIKVGAGTYPYYCQFSENTLWKIRNLFVAAGFNIPKKRINVDPNKAVGKSIGVTLQDAEWDGKMQSEIESVFPVSELEGDGEPDEADEEDEGEEEEADDEEEDTDSDDEDEEDDEEEPSPPPKKSKKDKKKKAKVSDDELEELDIEDI